MSPSDLYETMLPEKVAPQLRLLPAPRVVRGPVANPAWAVEPKAVANLGRWLRATGQLGRIDACTEEALLRLMGDPFSYTHLYDEFRASGEWRMP